MILGRVPGALGGNGHETGFRRRYEIHFGAMLAALGVPVGGPEATKRDKNSTKIALKFDADYGMHFGT